MEIAGHFYLGRILKSIGFQGQMLVLLDVDDPMQYKNLDAVFVYVGGNLVPFFIEKMNLREGKQAEINFQDIDDTGQTELLIGKSLYLPLAALPQLEGNQFYYHEITGFMVSDAHVGEIGRVESVLEYPKQALLQVMHQNKEILIPIADEIVLEVDRQNRIIYVRVPEGLIEMYLE